jgi:DNA-directed RNA polymerase specialized sigma24 family protein
LQAWMDLRVSLVRYLRRRGVGHADAEDAVQSVFFHLLARKEILHTLLGAQLPDDRERYLRRACINAIHSENRALVRRKCREREWGLGPSSSGACETAIEPDQRAVEISMLLTVMYQALPSPIVRAFALCDVQGLSARHAATILDVPVGTVKTWLRRARSFLRAVVAV